MKSFIKDNIERNNYITNSNIKLNAEYLLKITNDYEIYNKIDLIKKPKYMDKVNLNKQLVNSILNDLPNNFTKLESAIFIYIKLCRILTHDEADVDKKYLIINHRDINRISTINDDNNIIVCYEFVAIFAKFLDILGLDYEIIGPSKYGLGHCSLNILYKGLYLKFDSTLGLFDCDLTKIKNNIKACGINIIKSNPQYSIEFDQSMDNVYEYIKNKYNESYFLEHDLVKKYRNKFDYYSLEKKKRVFFEEIKYCDLPPIDTIKYIKLLKRIIFNKNDKFEMELITTLISNKYLGVSYIFAFRNNLNEIIKNEYYIYTYPNNVKRISKEEILNNFNNNQYNYIEYKRKKIKHLKFQ